MNAKTILAILGLILFFHWSPAQSLEELEKQKVEKEKELAQSQQSLKELTNKVKTLEKEVASLTDKTTPYPRWDKGLFGTLGFNLSNYNDWLAKNTPNISSVNIGVAFNGFINLDQKKFFWQNTGNLTLGWLKFNNKDLDNDDDGFQVSADLLQLNSLFGLKFSKKLAFSSVIDYRTSLLEGTFNNPGYLNFGSLGIAWKPNSSLAVSVHSLSYNLILAEKGNNSFESSFGAKIVGDYTRKLPKGIAWKSNLSAFLSYKNVSDLSDWIWTNSFTTAVKGVGIGLTLGLRESKQEARALERTDNPLQSYWLLGLSYSL